MQVQYAAEARKDLQGLDKAVATRIIKKISTYASADNPLVHAKALSGNLKGLYRFRVGDYRIIKIFPAISSGVAGNPESSFILYTVSKKTSI